MGFMDDLADMMPDTVTAIPGAHDAYGTFIASGATLALACRIEGAQRLVRDLQGQQVVSTVQVILGSAPGLTVEGYRFNLPARYTPNAAIRAISIEPVSDESGPLYEVINLP